MKEKRCRTMCIVHKGFRGFRGVSPASNLGGSLIGLKPAIPYDTIHATLAVILETQKNENNGKNSDLYIFNNSFGADNFLR